MSNIKINSDEFRGFYAVWMASLANRGTGAMVNDAFRTINDEFNIMTTIPPSFLEATNEEKTQYFHQIMNLESKIFNKEVRNIDDLCSNMQNIFSVQEDNPAILSLRHCYGIYSDFQQKMAKENEKAVGILSSHVAECDLEKLSRFFGAEIENEHNICILPKKTISGQAGACWTNQFFALEREDGVQDYIGDSCVQERKLGTAMHETTHRLYHSSAMYNNIKTGADPEMNKFIENMSKWIEENPEFGLHLSVLPRASAFNALDEAFATCPAAYDEEEKNGQLAENREWYYGFEAANKVAPYVYSVFKEYVDEGRLLDDNFFAKLNERTECLFNAKEEGVKNSAKLAQINQALLNKMSGEWRH